MAISHKFKLSGWSNGNPIDRFGFDGGWVWGIYATSYGGNGYDHATCNSVAYWGSQHTLGDNKPRPFPLITCSAEV